MSGGIAASRFISRTDASGSGADCRLATLGVEAATLTRCARESSEIRLSGVISEVSRFYPKGVSTWWALAWILLSEANSARSYTTTIERKLR